MLQGLEPAIRVSEKFTEQAAKLSLLDIHIWTVKPRSSDDVHHWRTNFTLAPNSLGVSALSLDMRLPDRHEFDPANSERYGSLLVDVRGGPRIISQNAAVNCAADLRLAPPVTAGDLLQLIKEKRMQYYRFKKEGSGCLCWQILLLRFMMEKGWLPNNMEKKLRRQIEDYLRKLKHKNQLPYPPVEGDFYSPPVKEHQRKRSSVLHDTANTSGLKEAPSEHNNQLPSPTVDGDFNPPPILKDHQSMQSRVLHDSSLANDTSTMHLDPIALPAASSPGLKEAPSEHKNQLLYPSIDGDFNPPPILKDHQSMQSRVLHDSNLTNDTSTMDLDPIALPAASSPGLKEAPQEHKNQLLYPSVEGDFYPPLILKDHQSMQSSVLHDSNLTNDASIMHLDPIALPAASSPGLKEAPQEHKNQLLYPSVEGDLYPPLILKDRQSMQSSVLHDSNLTNDASIMHLDHQLPCPSVEGDFHPPPRS
ncbi:hypothetical protein APHAL10511_002953 [Amanita phalloides]|nr:hypothetical protein APHAL10511_002953 [Amanita phalloides]